MSAPLAELCSPSAALGLVPAAPLAFLEGIGAMEMMLVAVIGLLLFGGKGLPDMARTVGKVVREFKKATQGVEDEVRRVMHEEPENTRPARPARPRPRPQAQAQTRSLPSPSPAPSAPAPAPVPRDESTPRPPAGPELAPPPRVTPPPSSGPDLPAPGA